MEEKLNLILSKLESLETDVKELKTDVKELKTGQAEIKVDIQKVKEKIEQNHMEAIDESARVYGDLSKQIDSLSLRLETVEK